MCFICGRGNCCPMFHSIEEQAIFARAGEAYDMFVEIHEHCLKEARDQEEAEQ